MKKQLTNNIVLHYVFYSVSFTVFIIVDNFLLEK
jgi:hypothetical protein